MLSKNRIKYIKSLSKHKYRQQHKCFIAEGEKMVVELLKSDYKIEELFATSTFINKYRTILPDSILITETDESELKKVSQLKTPNMALALIEIPLSLTEFTINDKGIVVLDGIQDPGNMGTIMRTANWFGFNTLVCSEDCVDVYNFKVVQATMGAIFRLSIIVADIRKLLQKAIENEVPVYGTLLDGDNIYTSELQDNGIIVLGNESKGISEPIRELITHKIRIPDFPENRSGMESLNVGIAGAIVMSEFRRKL